MNPDLSDAMEHLYVHVPFCDGKCDYCAFYSVVASDSVRRDYAAWVGRELKTILIQNGHDRPCKPRTVYFGGGTPTLLGAEGLKILVDGLAESAILSEADEWTVEANPAGLDFALAHALKDLGVNRVSVGAQSFQDHVLQSIGRRHQAREIMRAVESLRSAQFTNIGLDLIAALPGVSDQEWQSSLREVVKLGVEHVSVYALGIEDGTRLKTRLNLQEISVPDAEAQIAALDTAEHILGEAGFMRYEISNFAKPGFECRHNLSCWRGEDYLGLGPSASSRAQLRRWTNRSDFQAYCHALQNSQTPPCEAETNDPILDATERVMFNFRLAEGVDLNAFASRHPAAQERLPEWRRTLERLSQHQAVEQGLDGRWRLTARGREVADAVIQELV